MGFWMMMPQLPVLDKVVNWRSIGFQFCPDKQRLHAGKGQRRHDGNENERSSRLSGASAPTDAPPSHSAGLACLSWVRAATAPAASRRSASGTNARSAERPKGSGPASAAADGALKARGWG